jgi:transcriptional regulator with XRE-family HTH domain
MPLLDLKLIGSRVRHARERTGLTQAALAEATGVTDETVGRLERGAFEPTLATLVAVADALGEGLDTLVRQPPPRRTASRAAESAPMQSPLARRLAERAELLPPESVRLLLRLAELLPAQVDA